MALGGMPWFIPFFLTLLVYGLFLWVIYKIVTTLVRIAKSVDEIKTILLNNTARSDVRPE